MAPWGLPKAWRRVLYKFNGLEKESKSSLVPLIEKLKPDKIIVTVLDTSVQEKFNNYEHLCENVKKYYKEFCKNELDYEMNEESIIVAPGVGTFKVKGQKVRFEGQATDFYYFLIFELAKRLVNVVEQDGLTVYLDLTHGMNFMSTLMYRALYDILGAMAYAHKNITLNVYNAEPYTGDVDKLCIHQIEFRRILPRLSSRILGEYDGKAWLLKGYSSEGGETMRFKKEETAELNAFLSAIVNGFPLALYTFFPQKEEVRKRLEDAYECWRRHIECRDENGEIHVRRGLRFEEDFMRCVRLWVAAETFGIGRKEEVYLDELQKQSERLFWREGAKRGLISRTLEEIKERAENVGEEWESLREVFSRSGKRVGNFSPSNFLAHAGLEYNVTEIRTEQDRLKLRYSQGMRNDVVKACCSALLRLGSETRGSDNKYPTI